MAHILLYTVRYGELSVKSSPLTPPFKILTSSDEELTQLG